MGPADGSMGLAAQSIALDLPPARAFELWTDVGRWPTFIDGFGHADRVDDTWPRAGAKLVWRSKPHGRGQVTEKVLRSDPPHLISTTLLEERLAGTQTASFELDEEGRTVFELELDYRLTRAGVLSAITDFLFIRRAVRDSLARTCRRFASEAAEEASL
jgi:uncharacterized protein YndB with AHSA1/START domain